MKFRMNVNLDNAAFADDPAPELGRLLEVVHSQVRDGQRDGLCVDINGNRVGEWVIARRHED